MYIRTKDGIYEVVTAERGSDNKLLYIISTSKTENTTDWVHEADVILQADTIEELCDEGVIEIKFGSTGYISHFKKHIYDLKKFLKYLEECKPITKDEILNVYGAIWIDGIGLVYVAKMNDKGELELI